MRLETSYAFNDVNLRGFYNANKSIMNQRNIEGFVCAVISPLDNKYMRKGLFHLIGGSSIQGPPLTNEDACTLVPVGCAHYCFISSLFKLWSFTRVPLVTGG